MSDKWWPVAGHLSVPLRHADGREFTAAELRTLDGAGSPELRNIGRGLPAASETTPAARTPNSDLLTKLAAVEGQLAVQRALADERLMMFDQLRATVRALDGGITKAKSKPRWWRKS